MPLVQANLKAQLIALFTLNENNETAKEDFADSLATIITDYIKTATVNVSAVQVNAGIPVSTAGGPTAQTGATTSPGTLSNTGTLE